MNYYIGLCLARSFFIYIFHIGEGLENGSLESSYKQSKGNISGEGWQHWAADFPLREREREPCPVHDMLAKSLLPPGQRHFTTC